MRGRLIAVGLATYALGLLVMAPASLLDAALAQASDGRLRLAGAQGSRWSGSGQIEMRAAGSRTGAKSAGQAGVAKSLPWRFLPLSLLGGHAACEVQFGQTGKPFVVAASWSRIDIADADLDLPAKALGLAVPKLAALTLTGDMLLHVAYLSIDKQGVKGDATLQWRTAGSALTSVSPLGDYELRLEDRGAAVHVSLRTLQGPLQLDGQGSWASGGRPAFLATARISPQHIEQLAPLLRLIAIERGEGSFELQLQ
jgi:general secretion pathway protein N